MRTFASRIGCTRTSATPRCHRRFTRLVDLPQRLRCCRCVCGDEVGELVRMLYRYMDGSPPSLGRAYRGSTGHPDLGTNEQAGDHASDTHTIHHGTGINVAVTSAGATVALGTLPLHTPQHTLRRCTAMPGATRSPSSVSPRTLCRVRRAHVHGHRQRHGSVRAAAARHHRRAWWTGARGHHHARGVPWLGAATLCRTHA